ncbi:uncharacterized protein [Epargyreus clarus]|uniref:uncharacterized protein n=1 Tax=Epargyreus clarus TaxID=520877 RepID=UPI003C2ED6C3
MEVTVTTFTNPFSFFCVVDEISREFRDVIHSSFENVEAANNLKKSISDVNHGQYVAVMWKNKWTRGVITMESQFLIWLVDYGIYIHPDDKSVYTDLPVEYRKHPTKVFEAAIHGVTPLDKVISDDCQIQNAISTSWNKGSVDKCQELLKSAIRTYFVPIALMTTKSNDVVLGDLYLEMSKKKIVNIIDELELWPVFLEKNKEVYVENLSKYFITRRKHRACILKPNFEKIKLPTVTLQMSLQEYTTLVDNKPVLSQLFNIDSEDGDTDVDTEVNYEKNKDAYRLTPAEIEKYSKLYITVHGCEYNVLNLLVNKARDLRMCERYRDHDLKSIGRGISFRGSYRNDI